jgi:predicted metal-dependent HD superfamily phosphohydrolase
MDYQLTIKQAEDFIRKYIHAYDNPNLVYHNILHTENVVSVTNQIAKQHQLSDKELFIVTAAAWFLHIGYYKDLSDPEQASIKITGEFFQNSQIDEETIHSIEKCILAPKNSQTSKTFLEKIICDADSFYIGTEKFFEYNKLKRKEFELLNNARMDKDVWRKRAIQLLESHQYYTDYCKQYLNANKMANLEKLRKKDQEIKSLPNPVTSPLEEKSDVAER